MRGLSSLLTQVLVLTRLNRPSGVTPSESARCTRLCSGRCLLVLYWTGTWWSRVDDERVKEGKRLIFLGLCSRLSSCRESARNRERERERKKDKGTQDLMEQRCFIEFCKSIYIPVASLDKDQAARLYKVTKEARSNSGHKTKRRSI